MKIICEENSCGIEKSNKRRNLKINVFERRKKSQPKIKDSTKDRTKNYVYRLNGKRAEKSFFRFSICWYVVRLSHI